MVWDLNFLLPVWVIITSVGGSITLSLLTLFTFLYLWRRGFKLEARYCIFTYVGGEVAVHLLKLMIARPRPSLIAPLIPVRTLSFPSGHAFLSAAVGMAIAMIFSKVQNRSRVGYIFIALVVSFAVGTSRIVLGVHYLSDVIGGWLLGITWATLLWLAFNFKLAKK